LRHSRRRKKGHANHQNRSLLFKFHIVPEPKIIPCCKACSKSKKRVRFLERLKSFPSYL
jgi:hypothetical protein